MQKHIKVPKKAMVFAAGLGTRMAPITDKIPKPMVEVCGKPLIDYRLDKLVEAGIETAVVNTFYLPETIENHLKKRKDIEIIISREEKRLETGGGLKKAMPYLGTEPFYLVNSDVIWIDKEFPALLRLAQNWNPEKMSALLLLHEVAKSIGYIGNGDFELADDGNIIRPETVKRKYVFTGIQIFNPELLNEFREEIFSLSEVFKRAFNSANNKLNRLYGLPHIGDWLHIDSVEGLKQSEMFLEKTF